MNYYQDLSRTLQKPSKNCYVIDRGLPLPLLAAYIEQSRHYISSIKLGWTTALFQSDVKEKVKLIKDNGIAACLGGSFFEIAAKEKKLTDFKEYIDRLGIEVVEVSSGFTALSSEEIQDYIAELSKSYEVYAEIGLKSNAPQDFANWPSMAAECLEAGASKIIFEGREKGNAGIYDNSGEIVPSFLENIHNCSLDRSNLIFEAPLKKQQLRLIKEFGASVLLGNIAFEDIVPVQTYRNKLSGDTYE